VVVHNEHAVRLEHSTYFRECLFGEKKALETDIGVATVQDQRVHAAVHDQVIFAVGGAQEMPAVVKVTDDSLVLVRVVGVGADADVLDHGVDLDRVDAFPAKAQRVSDVVARAGADNQDISKRRTAAVLLQQMN